LKINCTSTSTYLAHLIHLLTNLALLLEEFISLSFKTFALFLFIACFLTVINAFAAVIFQEATLTSLLLLQGSMRAFSLLVFSKPFAVFQPWLSNLRL
jgi:hypothetical protein